MTTAHDSRAVPGKRGAAWPRSPAPSAPSSQHRPTSSESPSQRSTSSCGRPDPSRASTQNRTNAVAVSVGIVYVRPEKDNPQICFTGSRCNRADETEDGVTLQQRRSRQLRKARRKIVRIDNDGCLAGLPASETNNCNDSRHSRNQAIAKHSTKPT